MNAQELTGHNPRTLKEIAKCRTSHYGDWIYDARAELAEMSRIALDSTADPELRIKASAQACKLRDQLLDMISVPKRPSAPSGPTSRPLMDATPL